MVVRRERKRHKHRRLAGGAQLGNDRRASPADHEVRLRKQPGHVVEEGRSLRLNAGFAIGSRHLLGVPLAGLMQQARAPPTLVAPNSDRLQGGFVQANRALATAENQDRKGLARRLFPRFEEFSANRQFRQLAGRGPESLRSPWVAYQRPSRHQCREPIGQTGPGIGLEQYERHVHERTGQHQGAGRIPAQAQGGRGPVPENQARSYGERGGQQQERGQAAAQRHAVQRSDRHVPQVESGSRDQPTLEAAGGADKHAQPSPPTQLLGHFQARNDVSARTSGGDQHARLCSGPRHDWLNLLTDSNAPEAASVVQSEDPP